MAKLYPENRQVSAFCAQFGPPELPRITTVVASTCARAMRRSIEARCNRACTLPSTSRASTTTVATWGRARAARRRPGRCSGMGMGHSRVLLPSRPRARASTRQAAGSGTGPTDSHRANPPSGGASARRCSRATDGPGGPNAVGSCSQRGPQPPWGAAPVKWPDGAASPRRHSHAAARLKKTPALLRRAPPRRRAAVSLTAGRPPSRTPPPRLVLSPREGCPKCPMRRSL